MANKHELNECKESIRELRFKLTCYGLMMEHAMKHLPEEVKAEIGNGLFRLAIGHRRGEKDLSWSFGEKIVKAAAPGYDAPAQIHELEPVQG